MNEKIEIDRLKTQIEELSKHIQERSREEDYRVHSAAEKVEYGKETNRLRLRKKALSKLWNLAAQLYSVGNSADAEARRKMAEAEAQVKRSKMINQQVQKLITDLLNTASTLPASLRDIIRNGDDNLSRMVTGIDNLLEQLQAEIGIRKGQSANGRIEKATH